MTVRKFKDRGGRAWRAWEIGPSSFDPLIAPGDSPVDRYRRGWVVFEAMDGAEKRRLFPAPANWVRLPAEQLPELLEAAEWAAPAAVGSESIPRPRHLSDAPPGRRATDRRSRPRSAPAFPDAQSRVVRSFRYPGGRLWSAYVASAKDGGQPVLRFTAGARSVELRAWPPDWPDYAADRLVELLRRAKRAPQPPPAAGAPRRRHDDPRA